VSIGRRLLLELQSGQLLMIKLIQPSNAQPRPPARGLTELHHHYRQYYRHASYTGSARMIPEPDYNVDDDLTVHVRRNNNSSHHHHHHHPHNNNRLNETDRLFSSTILDKDGLVVARKPQNPCADSNERRDLHRELLFNQKVGKPVLNQKTELQKAMQKHKEHQSKKELEMERLSSRTSLEKVLEERARRLEVLERGINNELEESGKSKEQNEFLKMHAKLRGRVEATTQ